jgi:DNA mismatch endonuclease (patch repair protein)
MSVNTSTDKNESSIMDNLTPEQRSYTMSRIRGKDTAPELAIRRIAHQRGLRYRKHMGNLPGKPDLVFLGAKVAVFVDGDFWHGWRFPLWSPTLTPFWREKIEKNRRRDARNFRLLRRSGWWVVRIWEHQVERDPDACVDRIQASLAARRNRTPAPT